MKGMALDDPFQPRPLSNFMKDVGCHFIHLWLRMKGTILCARQRPNPESAEQGRTEPEHPGGAVTWRGMEMQVKTPESLPEWPWSHSTWAREHSRSSESGQESSRCQTNAQHGSRSRKPGAGRDQQVTRQGTERPQHPSGKGMSFSAALEIQERDPKQVLPHTHSSAEGPKAMAEPCQNSPQHRQPQFQGREEAVELSGACKALMRSPLSLYILLSCCINI